VSAAALTVLFTQIDVTRVIDALSLSAARWLLPALALYGLTSLGLEAISLARLVADAGGALALRAAARIKAATYLLGIVQYALGLGALTLLLRRRAGVALGDAAGVALTISALDLLILLALSTAGALALGAETAELRVGVLVALGVGSVLGLALLRMPGSLGPIERIRQLSVFRALRVARTSRLIELLVLRALFVSSFIALAGAALRGFGVQVPLGDLVVGVAAVTLVAALPIAVAGIGTSQAAFVFIFRNHADEATLLACNLALSAGLILLRLGIGLAFAREFAREAREVAEA
jgi:uncharacterized membrane protein YbhN (UPF0104 family)